ncbi:MAG: ABC transporter permease [Bdellovibrionaceae bacterium]|nr:ABC transporter permease [Pseudobdellovibrionaceae bacterium]
MKRLWPPFLLALVGLALLELAGRLQILNTSLLPTPGLILESYQENASDYAEAFQETFLATFFGFLASAILGLGAAFVLSLSDLARRAFLPFAIFFQTVPIIAIAPLLVIYLGFGSSTVIASSLIVSLFPVLANGLLGLQSLDPGELELFKLYRATSSEIFWKLRLPRAYPSFYAGLKVSAGLAVIGTVAGEFVAGGGLGALIDSARTQQRIDLVFGALILLSLIGLILIGALRGLNALINLKRPYGLLLKDE